MVVKFGLFGTGPWATDVHGPALAAHPQAELVGVWGRNPAKAAALAGALSARPYAEVDALLADVDAIAVALPPDVQAPIALQAARAGRHLLLDKPVALAAEAADAILAEVDARGLASVVFFTLRFQAPVDAFLREHAQTAWFGGRTVLHASIFQPGSPALDSQWRREHGGLWDIGPHALSMLLPALGPVARVAAMTGPHHSTGVLLEHHGGAVSTMSLTLDAPPAAATWDAVLYGPDGPVPLPGGGTPPLEAFGTAIDALVGQACGERAEMLPSARPPSHPCDVRLGRDVVAILAAAEAARTAGTVIPVPAAAAVRDPRATG